MKKVLLILLMILAILTVNGCSIGEELVNSNEAGENIKSSNALSVEESKRVNLFVTAMEAAFEEENGGNEFVAVRMDSLQGLSDEGKKEVVNRLKSISENVYDFDEIKEDDTKFEKENGHLRRSINGTLLSINLEEYKGATATIEATSWFGNLGAVFPKYKANYKNGKWELKLISIAIS